MAPEVFMQSDYNEKADVYNYGLCIWEVFAEQVPFGDLPSGMMLLACCFLLFCCY